MINCKGCGKTLNKNDINSEYCNICNDYKEKRKKSDVENKKDTVQTKIKDIDIGAFCKEDIRPGAIKCKGLFILTPLFVTIALISALIALFSGQYFTGIIGILISLVAISTSPVLLGFFALLGFGLSN